MVHRLKNFGRSARRQEYLVGGNSIGEFRLGMVFYSRTCSCSTAVTPCGTSLRRPARNGHQRTGSLQSAVTKRSSPKRRQGELLKHDGRLVARSNSMPEPPAAVARATF